jgi:hypothetical protein
MNPLIQIKAGITRFMGPDKWNDVLLKSGFKKFKKAQPELAAQVEKNIKYKDIHKGERCFIIGNGPSLKQQDLSLLRGEYVLTCNQLMRNPVFPQLRTSYHFWADPTFFALSPDRPEDMELLEVMLSVNTEGNKPVNFFAQEGFEFAKRFNLEEKLDIAFYAHRLELTDKYNNGIHFEKFTPNLHTVVHYAVAMAIYMGFSEIYLLGCDCTNVITAANTRLMAGDGAEYAYNISENEKKRMMNRNNAISMEDELKSFYEVFKGYRVLRDICEKSGIKLYNCTAGGLLDCVERKKYEDVIGR